MSTAVPYRPLVGRVGRVLAVLAILLALLTTAAVLWVNSDSGRSWLLTRAGDAAAAAGLDLETEGVAGRLPVSLSAERIRLGDSAGVWLELRGLDLSWSPWCLLAGRLCVEKLLAAEVDLRRLPELPRDGSPPAAERKPPPLDLLGRLRIGRLDFGRVAIGERVLGHELIFSVDGQFGLAEAQASVSRLDLTGLEGHRSSLDARIRWEAGARTLAIEVAARAVPEGGLVAVLGLPDGEGVDLALHGAGTLDQWNGSLVLSAGDARSDLMLTTGWTAGADAREPGPSRSLRLEGRIDGGDLLARHVPAELAALLEGGADVRVHVDETGPDALRLADLRVATPVIVVTGAADLDYREQTIAGELGIVQTDGETSPLPGGEVTGLDARVRLEGSWSAPALALAATADGLSLAGFAFDAMRTTADLRPAAANDVAAPFELTLGADGFAWDLSGMERLARGPVTLRAGGDLQAGQGVHVDEFLIALPDASIEGSLDVDLAAGSLSAPLTVEVTDLDALDPLVAVDLAGRGRFDVDLTLPGFDGRAEVSASGRLAEAALNLPVAGALVSPDMDLAADLTLGPDRGLAVSSFRLGGDRAVVTGRVAMPPGFARLEVDAVATVPDGSILTPALGVPLAGPASADVRVDGPAGDPGLTATLRFQRAAPGGIAFERVLVDGRLEHLATGLSGPIRAVGTARSGRFQLDTRLALEPDRLDLIPLTLAGQFGTASGGLGIHFEGPPLRGEIDLDLADAGPVLGLAQLRGSGKARGRLTFAAAGERQDLRLRAEGEALRLDLSEQRPIAADQLNLEADLEGLLSTPRLDARMTAADLTGPSSDLDAMELTARGPLDDLQFALDLEGQMLQAPAELSAEVGLARPSAATLVTLNRLAGSVGGHVVQSVGTPSLTIGDGRLDLAGTRLVLGDGELDVALRTGVPDSRFALTARDVPLSLASLVNPALKLDGRFGGELILTAQGKASVGAVALEFEEVRLPRRRSGSPITATLTGRLAPRGVVFEAQARGDRGNPLVLTGEVPLTVNLVDGSASILPGERLQGRLAWDGEARHLLNLLPASDHDLSGPLRIALDVSGTPARPAVAGEVRLEEARYENLLVGTILAPLNARIVGNGRELRVEQLEAGDGARGRVTGGGRIGLDPESRLPAELTLAFEKAVLVRRDDLTARASGSVSLSGAGDERLIEGRIATELVEVNLVNQLPPEVVDLEVIDVTAAERPGGEAPAPPAVAALDITVNIPRRLFVRGLGLDSEWEGGLQVGGTTDAPRVSGRIESVRGILQFIGRRFRFEPSTITFAGGRRIDPELDITTLHEAEDLDVTARVTGPVSDIDIELSSNPSVPEDEILSRTLFGKSTGQLSALEAVQLAAAVGEMSGRTGGPASVMTRLRTEAGIDVLRFGSTETEEGEQATTLEAGKYLADGLYVGVETSTAEESGAVSVEYDITRRIRLKTDLEQAGGQNIGVEYKRDY